jgi:LEA14-like dessication related protein
MKKGAKIALFSIIGVLILSVVIGYIKAKKWISEIRYGLANGVRITQFTVQNVSILLPIWFYNPSPFSLVVSDLDLRIYLNNEFVSTIKSPSNYRLNSKVNSTYPITINVKYRDIINLLAKHGAVIDDPDWLKKVNVRVVGDVKLDVGLFSMRRKINIEDSLKSYVG